MVQNTLIVFGFSVLMTQLGKKLLIRFHGGVLSWEPSLDLIRVLLPPLRHSVPKHRSEVALEVRGCEGGGGCRLKPDPGAG